MAAQRATKLKRLSRVKQIQKCLVLGMAVDEIADKLGVSTKTIERDIEWQYDQMTKDGGREIVTHRAAILAELGRTYAEAVRAGEEAKKSGEPLFPYLNSRIRAMALMARITGAEAPSRHFLLHGFAGSKGGVTPPSTPDGKLVIEYVTNGYESQPDTSHLLKDCSVEVVPDEQAGDT